MYQKLFLMLVLSIMLLSGSLFGMGFGSVQNSQLSVETDKMAYGQNDPILVSGHAYPDSSITLLLTDTTESIVQKISIISDETGNFAEERFKIPTDVQTGTWKIKLYSGSSFAISEFEVISEIQEDMIVIIDRRDNVPGIGNMMNFKVSGAQNITEISIVDKKGNRIEHLVFTADKQGNIVQPWIIPKDVQSGKYTITATDGFNSASAVFVLDTSNEEFFYPLYDTGTDNIDKTDIPTWVKTNTCLWSDGKVTDPVFVFGISHLHKSGIVTIREPHKIDGISDVSIFIPTWVKNNADLWCDGTIDHNTFFSAITYLFDMNIIQIDETHK